MLKKILISTAALYILILMQTSFFLHFTVLRLIPNFAFIFLIIFNIIEDPKERTGIYLAAAGGLLLDVFSTNFIGLNIIIMLFISLSIKFIIKRYVGIPFAEKA